MNTPRTPQTSIHAQVKGHGRAWIEAIDGDNVTVRFDCDDRPRSRCFYFPLSQIDFGYVGWDGWRQL